MTKHILHYKSTFTDSETYDLIPINSQKSFYGKATVTDYGDIKVLRSYGTPVVAMTPQGVFFKLWDGYSVTTQKHISSFVGRPISKKEWDQLALNDWSYRRTEAGDYEGWGVWSEVKEVEG